MADETRFLTDFRNDRTFRKSAIMKSTISAYDHGILLHASDDRDRDDRDHQHGHDHADGLSRRVNVHVCVHGDVHACAYENGRAYASSPRECVHAHVRDHAHVRADACVHVFRSF